MLHLNIQKGKQNGFTNDLKAGETLKLESVTLIYSRKVVRTDGAIIYIQLRVTCDSYGHWARQ